MGKSVNNGFLGTIIDFMLKLASAGHNDKRMDFSGTFIDFFYETHPCVTMTNGNC